MKMTIILIGLLLFVTLTALYANKVKGINKSNVTKTKVDENHYFTLRNQAISTTIDNLELNLDNDNEIYGIIMDWNMGNAIITVVSFKTGDASIYLSTGQMFIGGYAHPTVENAAKQFVDSGKNYLSLASLTEDTEPTGENKVNFYFLTKSGKFYIEENYDTIKNESSELYGLFISANKVITEYRLITEEQKE